MKKITILFTITLLLFISGCQKQPENIVLSVRNDVIYTYDGETTMETDAFSKIDSVSKLFGKCGSNIVHSNNGIYYTVYSLKDNRLCYVFFEYDEENGTDMRRLEFLEYPNADNEKKIKSRVLSKDYPENIIKN